MSTPGGPECFIFRLSNELLICVLNDATLEYRNYRKSDLERELIARKTARELPLVCRRFYAIAQPLLYETAALHHVDLVFTSDYMHRTMEENPHMRSLCKSIVLDVWECQSWFDNTGAVAEIFEITRELFSWWTSARSVYIVGLPEAIPFNSKGWALVQTACQNMPRLKELYVGMEGPLHLCKAIETIQSPSVNVLTLKAYPCEPESDSWTVDPKLLRSSPITSLSIKVANTNPSDLAQAIQWPVQLEKFALGELFEIDRGDNHITYPLVQSLLSIHEKTLKEIRIKGLDEYTFGPKFNASGFPNLEVLSLALYQYRGPTGIRGENPTYGPEEDSFLPPKLKTLRFTYGSSKRVKWDWFQEKDEQFIRNIATAAIYKKSPLQTIEVDYVPYDKYAERHWGYPYERLERLSQEFGPQGIKISYPTPPKTKREWVFLVAWSRIYRSESRHTSPDPDGLMPEDILEVEDLVQAVRVGGQPGQRRSMSPGLLEEMLKEMLEEC